MKSGSYSVPFLMEDATKRFDYNSEGAVFRNAFAQLAEVLPKGITRTVGRKTTPLNLYEGVAVGAALVIRTSGTLEQRGVNNWMKSKKLGGFTVGATNNKAAVVGRIEYCRDRFLGLPDVG